MPAIDAAVSIHLNAAGFVTAARASSHYQGTENIIPEKSQEHIDLGQPAIRSLGRIRRAVSKFQTCALNPHEHIGRKCPHDRKPHAPTAASGRQDENDSQLLSSALDAGQIELSFGC